MFTRRRLLQLSAASLLVPSLGFAAKGTDVEPIATLRLNSMHPSDSPWGRVLHTWARAAEKATQDKLLIEVTNNGGEFAVDESDLIDRMRGEGRLRTEEEDMLALSAAGLMSLSAAFLPFQLGDTFADTAALDAARLAGQGAIDDALEAQGLMQLTWGHEGRRALLTKGVTARGPSDLAGAPMWVAEGDVVTAALAQQLGAVVVRAPLAKVRRMLEKGEIAALVAPLLQARALGWTAKADGLVDAPLGWNLGAVVVRQAALEPVDAFIREALIETAPKAGQALGRRIHQLDAEAWAEARGQLNAPALAEASVEQWQDVLVGAKAALIAEGLLSQETLDALQAAPAEEKEAAPGWG